MKIYTIPVGMLQTNCYFVVNEELREAVIFDPGGDPDKLLIAAEKLEVKVVAICLTHGHSSLMYSEFCCADSFIGIPEAFFGHSAHLPSRKFISCSFLLL